MRRRTKKSVRKYGRRDLEEDFGYPGEEAAESAPEEEKGADRSALALLDIPVAGTYTPSYIPPPRSRLFSGAFLFSLALHLSMVTLFNVVIYFPRQDIEYYRFQIVQARPPQVAIPRVPEALRAPTLDDPLGAFPDFEARPALVDRLPEVQLPTLEFAELDRLRVRQRTLDDSAFSDPAARDAWPPLGDGLRRIRESITDIVIPDAPGPLTTTSAAPSRLSHRPADGFEAEIEWGGEPRSRQLLYAPPVRALLDVDPAGVQRPFEVVFRVNPAGRVVNVWSPFLDETGLLDEVQMTVLQYRFEPLVSEGAPEQTGTLRIRAAGSAP
jgi:hypothetical protein